MKIAFLAGYNSIHTVRWVNEMAKRGHEVHLLTVYPGSERLEGSISVYTLPFKPPFGYYLNTIHVRRLLLKIKPDILNTHYASGYGTLARLSGFHPNLLSVWGADVFDFPYKSKSQMDLIRKNLCAADRIASTSHVMKRQVEMLYMPEKEIAVTPFGVECDLFKPKLVDRDNSRIRIGTVKTMAPKYGIATLIEAFALAKKAVNEEVELILVGGGPQEAELRVLAKKLGIIDCVQFVGPVPHADVPKWLNSFDIYAALSESESESFGVAVIEASACGVPVMVSDAGGLPEVVIDAVTGYIVPRKNPGAAAEKIIRLIFDGPARKSMGAAGREFVLCNYMWKENADRMEKLYHEVINDFRKA